MADSFAQWEPMFATYSLRDLDVSGKHDENEGACAKRIQCFSQKNVDDLANIKTV